MAAQVDTEKCDGCGPCVESCPVEAIKIENDKAVVDPDTCIDCGVCADACPNSALKVD